VNENELDMIDEDVLEFYMSVIDEEEVYESFAGCD